MSKNLATSQTTVKPTEKIPSRSAAVSVEIHNRDAADDAMEEDLPDLKFLSDSFPLSHHMDPAKSKRTPEEELRNGNWLPDELEVTSTRLEQELSKLGRRLGRAGDEQFTLEYYCPPDYKEAESYEEWSEADLKEFIITVWEKVKKFHSQFFQQQQQQQQTKTTANSTTPSSSGKAERPKGGGGAAANVVAAGGTTAVIITSIDDVWPRVKGKKLPEGKLTAQDTEDMARLVSNATQDVCHTEEREQLKTKLLCDSPKFAPEVRQLKVRMDTLSQQAKAIKHKQLLITQRLEIIKELIDGLNWCRGKLEFLKQEAAKEPKHKPTADSSSARKQPVTLKRTEEPTERRKSVEGKPSGSRLVEAAKSSTKSESKKTTTTPVATVDGVRKKLNLTPTAADGSGPGQVDVATQPRQSQVIPLNAVGAGSSAASSTATVAALSNKVATSRVAGKPAGATKSRPETVEEQPMAVDPPMSAQSQAEAMRLQIEELQRQLEASQTEIVTTTAQLERNQLDNNHKQTEIDRLEQRLQRMETELNNTKEQLALKRTEFADLQRTADDREVQWSSIVRQMVQFTAVHQPQQQQPTTSALPTGNPVAARGKRKRSDSPSGNGDGAVAEPEDNDDDDADGEFNYGDANGRPRYQDSDDEEEVEEDHQGAAESEDDETSAERLNHDQLEGAEGSPPQPQSPPPLMAKSRPAKKQKVSAAGGPPTVESGSRSSTPNSKFHSFAFDFDIEIDQAELERRMLGKKPQAMSEEQWDAEKERDYAAKLKELERVGVWFSDKKTNTALRELKKPSRDLRYMCLPLGCTSFHSKFTSMQEHRSGKRLTEKERDGKRLADHLQVHQATQQIAPIVVLDDRRWLSPFYNSKKDEKLDEGSGKLRGLNAAKVRDTLSYRRRDGIITSFTLLCQGFRRKHNLSEFDDGKGQTATSSSATAAAGRADSDSDD